MRSSGKGSGYPCGPHEASALAEAYRGSQMMLLGSEQAGPAGKKESGSDEPWVKEDQDDDPVNDFSDLPTIPLARSGRQIRKPAWHADYEM